MPAYNEEENIQSIVCEAKEYFPNSEIVVVDDGSTDRTCKWARRAGAKVLRHERNRGKGEAIKTGFKFFLKHSKADFIVVSDADGQYPIRESQKLVLLLQQQRADFVSGYRNWEGKPLRYKLGNFVWRHSFNLLFGTNFKDTNCGFMALTRDAVNKIRDIGGGYIIENELYIEALRNKLRIEQVLVTARYKKKNDVFRGVKVVFSVLIFIVREGLKHRLGLQ